MRCPKVLLFSPLLISAFALVMALVMAGRTVLAQHATVDTNAPALTEVQKLQVENALQKLEIAQLHLQAAKQETAQAREGATQLLHTLDVPGYTLDLQSLTYVKVPATPKVKNDPDRR